MLKRINQFIAAIMIAFSFGLVASPVVVHADTAKSDVCTAIGSNSGCTSNANNGVDIGGVVKTLINVLSVVAGVIAVIMLVIGGLRYITSAGDSSKVSGAKNTIVYSLVGLVIVACAQFIAQFVLDKVH